MNSNSVICTLHSSKTKFLGKTGNYGNRETRQGVYRANAGYDIRFVVDRYGTWFSVKDLLQVTKQRQQRTLLGKLRQVELRKTKHGKNSLRFVSITGLLGLFAVRPDTYHCRQLVTELIIVFSDHRIDEEEEEA